MNKISCIYKIINSKTGDLYIGSAVNFHRRQGEHRRQLRRNKHHSRYLQNAYNFYGRNAFRIEIIEKCKIQNLIDREGYWQKLLSPRYCVMKDIKSHIGIKRSEETKRKISISNTGKKVSKETRQKLRDINLGKKQSEETKKKRSISCKNSILFQSAVKSKNRNDKIRKTRLKNGGYVVTEKMKKEISKSLKSKNLRSAVSIYIEKYDLNKKFICKYRSMMQAEKDNNLYSGALSEHIHKLKKEKYRGFVWKIKS